MKIKPKQYAQGLLESIKDADKKQAKKIIENLAQVLVDNNQKSQLKKIINYFNLLWNKEKNIVEAEIISASKLDKKTLQILEEFINKKAGDDCQIELSEKIEKDIKGGFIIRLGDQILDASLSGRIRELEKSIN